MPIYTSQVQKQHVFIFLFYLSICFAISSFLCSSMHKQTSSLKLLTVLQ